MAYSTLITLLIFSFLPSIIWLLFYLRKDVHPEPNRMVLKIFLFGMLVTIPVAIIEISILTAFSFIPINLFLISLLNVFIGVALIEEVMKYFVVQQGVLKNPAFDEPVDAMLYMIIAALGFAAAENMILLCSFALDLDGVNEVYKISVMGYISSYRFLGATFLHVLASGTVGYFLALHYFAKKPKSWLLFGLGISILLHGLFNISIMISGETFNVVSIPLLLGFALFISLAFKNLKKLKQKSS